MMLWFCSPLTIYNDFCLDRHDKVQRVGRGSTVQPRSCLSVTEHTQPLLKSIGIWADQLLSGFAGRAAERGVYGCIRKLEETEESRAGRERKCKKRKALRYPEGEMGPKSWKQESARERGKGGEKYSFEGRREKE